MFQVKLFAECKVFVYLRGMDKDRLRDWMKRTGVTREQLAERCNTKVPTVNGWLAKNSTRGIPKPAQRIIEEWMNPKVPAINPKVSLETFGGLQARAAREGKSLDKLIGEILTAAAKLGVIALLLGVPFLWHQFPKTRPALRSCGKAAFSLIESGIKTATGAFAKL